MFPQGPASFSISVGVFDKAADSLYYGEIYFLRTGETLSLFLKSILLSLLMAGMGVGDCPAQPATGTPSALSTDKDYQELFQGYWRDAQRGDAKAMGVVGLMFEKGLGCPKDYEKAFHWLMRGAQKGDDEAQNNLGFLYYRGLWVPENGAEALRWFTKAADQGLASAQENLGLLYGEGHGVPKDDAKALVWFQKAAQQDYLEAQINLGQMLSIGEGAPKDMIEADKWFTLALKHSIDDGALLENLRNDLEWLEKHMAQKDIDEAKNRADAWHPSVNP